VALSAVLLDRDGTINVKAAEGDYITAPDQVTLLPRAAAAIRLLNERRIPVAVVTNQRGIALGRMSEADLEAVNQRLADLLAAEEGAALDAVLHCPHDAGTCRCRKPGTLLLERAVRHLRLDCFAGVVMIGDSATDVVAGLTVGARTVFLGSPEAAPEGADCAPTLWDAVRGLLPSSPAAVQQPPREEGGYPLRRRGPAGRNGLRVTFALDQP
jgi:D-glycero-D-manno-heptose 1,7-bisphosphate phosphatase